MKEKERLVTVGAACGITAVLLYFAVILSESLWPWAHARSTAEFLAAVGAARNGNLIMLVHFVGAAFAPLGVVALLGLNRLLTARRPSTTALVATVFGCIAFGLLAAMLIVQGTVMAEFGVRFLGSTEADRQNIVDLYRGLRAVDLGLDVSWDVFICLSFLLLGVSMLGNRHLGFLFGIVGIVIAGALLLLNVVTAPTPPASAGLVDLGPLAELWFLVVNVQALRSSRSGIPSAG